MSSNGLEPLNRYALSVDDITRELENKSLRIRWHDNGSWYECKLVNLDIQNGTATILYDNGMLWLILLDPLWYYECLIHS
jgi:hypothetical protein